MSNVRGIRTPLTEDALALEKLVNGLVEAWKAGKIRAAVVLYYDQDSLPHASFANTTLSDEAYVIQLLQARMTQTLLEK